MNCPQPNFGWYSASVLRRSGASAVIVTLAFCGGALAASQLFAPTSAWNMPVPPDAIYSGVSAAPSVVVGLDTWDSSNAWTIPGYVAKNTDPLKPLLYNSSAWYEVYTGEWAGWVIPNLLSMQSFPRRVIGSPIRAMSFPATLTTAWVLPPSYNKTVNPPYGPASFYFNTAMLPAPDTDGHRCVLQPNGLVVET